MERAPPSRRSRSACRKQGVRVSGSSHPRRERPRSRPAKAQRPQKSQKKARESAILPGRGFGDEGKEALRHVHSVRRAPLAMAETLLSGMLDLESESRAT